MTDAEPPPDQVGGYYFFLSYAHSRPTLERDDRPDPLVSKLYDDLLARVGSLARPRPGWRIGFADLSLPPGSDWSRILATALGKTQVFVPLYSPVYLSRAWSRGEHESFRKRLASAGRADSTEHIQPILWVPFPPPDHARAAGALSLVTDIPEYGQYGLLAMLRLQRFEAQYGAVLDQLARRIVDVAHNSTLRESKAPQLREVVDLSTVDGMTTPLVIAVLAPSTRAGIPHGSATDTYGALSVEWRPAGDTHGLPLATFAANIAERAELPTLVVDFGIDKGPDHCPMLVLIDPWILDCVGGRELVRAAITRARPEGRVLPWVTLIVAVNPDDPQHERGEALASQITDMLADAGVRGREPAQEVAEVVRSLPKLVAQTRDRYLEDAPALGTFESRPTILDRETPSPRRRRGPGE